jgi:hypothetical protein
LIDFIKLDVSYLDRTALDENENLKFKDTAMRIDQKVFISKATFSNMTFTVAPTMIILEGSLHKYYNIRNALGNQNHSQFTYDQILWVVNDLQKMFGINPERSKILNIEYGVNLAIDDNPSELLQSKVIFYKKNYPSWEDHYVKGYLLKFEFAEYIIKMYDKGAHQNAGQNLLRFEVRTKKSRTVGNKFGIRYLIDICDKENLLILHKDLMRRMKDVFIYDCINPIEKMTEREKQLFVQSQTKSFFNAMEGSSKDNQATRARKLLREMTEIYNLNTCHKSLLQKLELKKYELLPIAC